MLLNKQELDETLVNVDIDLLYRAIHRNIDQLTRRLQLCTRNQNFGGVYMISRKIEWLNECLWYKKPQTFVDMINWLENNHKEEYCNILVSCVIKQPEIL